MKNIADTGLLLAALNRNDPFHKWGAQDFLAHHLKNAIPGIKLVENGDLILEFNLSAQTKAVLDLLHKYRDRQMELADACLVWMTELEARCKIRTVDRDDFQVYRRRGRQTVPCEFPPDER